MNSSSLVTQKTYAIMAEFDSPEQLLEATRGAYERGYRMMEAYTPFPVEGLAEALAFHHSRVPAFVFCGGVLGGLTGYFMQWYSAVIDYPINVGGRPLHSWPAFIPITFEMTVLGAALAAVVGMLALNGLPRPHHPVFNVPEFVLASNNRFFLSIQARDPLFDPEETYRLLASLHAKVITVVPY
jgi:Alternative complex III, ActD subunit